MNHIPSGYHQHSHGIDGPFIDGLPIKNGDFPMLNNQMVLFRGRTIQNTQAAAPSCCACCPEDINQRRRFDLEHDGAMWLRLADIWKTSGKQSKHMEEHDKYD